MNGKKLPPLKTNFNGSELNLNNLLKKDNKTYYANEQGSRESLVFDTKITYSYADVIELLSKLDKLWEETKSTSEYDYVN